MPCFFGKNDVEIAMAKTMSNCHVLVVFAPTLPSTKNLKVDMEKSI